MFGAPEGLVWMTKGAVGAWYQDETISPGVDRQQLKKEQEKGFYQKFFLDVAANGKRTSPPPGEKKHPRTEYAVGGATASYDKITVMYGKNPHEISRTHVLHQDGALFAKQGTEAYLVNVPLPEPEERFVWVDLTYGVRGVYFPFCFDMPWPYDRYVQLLRLDFKHRYIRLPFARPFDAALVPQPERDLLPAQVEKAGLEIMPERSIVDGVLHPVLQNTTRFKKKVLGEKATNRDGEPSEERLFEHASTDAATKQAKQALAQWLKDCRGKGPTKELERAKTLDALAQKHGLDRNPKYYRAEIDHEDLVRDATQSFPQALKAWLLEFKRNNAPELNDRLVDAWVAPILLKSPCRGMTIKKMAEQSASEREQFVTALVKEFEGVYGFHYAIKSAARQLGDLEVKEEDRFPAQIARFRQMLYPDRKKALEANDQFLGMPSFTPSTHEDRLTLLSSPGGQPDCEICGHLDFTTEPELGLGLQQPGVTIRIDVRELMCCLALPQELTKRAGDKELGYQNVSGGDGASAGLPIDFYSRNLVLAFAARDIQVASHASTFTTKVTASAITFPGIIQSQLGLTMTYLPAPTPLEKQIALFMVQILSVAADLIPVVGPLVSFAIYIGGNTIIDAAWINQFENSAPPIFALLYSQKGNISKHALRARKKVRFALK